MAIIDRRKREREKRRNEIINAAENLFLYRGYTNVTMDGIAQKAEVNKALLYYYFKNKEALFFAVYLKIVQDLFEIFQNHSNKDTTGLNKIKAMSNEMYHFSREHPEKFRLYIYAGSEHFSDTKNPDAQEAIMLATGMWRLMVEAFLQGMQEGEIRNDMDPVQMSIYFNLLTMNTLNIDPVFKIILEARGINQDKLWDDLELFIQPALTKKSIK